jgi:hypothetical protein
LAMIDLLMLALMVSAFAACVAFVFLCERV